MLRNCARLIGAALLITSSLAANVTITASNATATITQVAPAPTCIAGTTDLDCVTSFYHVHHTCAPNDFNCEVAAGASENATSTDVDAATSRYHRCASSDINCMLSAYLEGSFATSATATSQVASPATVDASVTGASGGRTTGLTAATGSVYATLISTTNAKDHTSITITPKTSITSTTWITAGLPTDVASSSSSPVSSSSGTIITTFSTLIQPTTVPVTSTQPSPLAQTRCAPGNLTCEWDDPESLPPSRSNSSVYDPNDVQFSPMDDEGRINGSETPVAYYRRQFKNAKKSDWCYRKFVRNDKNKPPKKFYLDYCVYVFHPEATEHSAAAKYPHGGVWWYSPEAAKYHDEVRPEQSFRCVDLRTDTGCGYSFNKEHNHLGNFQKKRCKNVFKYPVNEKVPTYKPVDCDSIAPLLGLRISDPGWAEGSEVPQRPTNIATMIATARR